MALAGISCVGEFHYLHHGADGRPYAEPNVMGEALRAAASAAGIRLTLLDTCYVAGGVDRPLDGVQRRFGDGDADGWAARVSDLRPDRTTRIGAAVHSVRAVPADQLGTVAGAAAGGPLHVHLSEQPAENEQCLAAYGVTPTRLLGRHAVLGPDTTVVHATHLTDPDIAELGSTATTACFCPTTERDLADGIGPARRLADAGAPTALGSDQHAVIDLFEEARAVEMHERLSSGQRGSFAPAALVAAATATGHAALGWPEAGVIEVGAPADFVAVRLDTVRTAGSEPAEVMFAATAADVDTVVVGGRVIVRAGEHVLGDVGRMLADAVAAVV
jgi:formiminoglutamate deiminase